MRMDELWRDLAGPGDLTDIVKILLAYALAIPIGWEREKSTQIMGIRTFPLVAVASCGYVLVALTVAGESEEAQARVIQGLMGGIGFIGGGALLKQGASVRGTATAASIWTTGAIGGAVGFGSAGIAIALAIVNIFTLVILTRIERRMNRDEGEEDRVEDDKG